MKIKKTTKINVSVSVEITKDKCFHINTVIKNAEAASCEKQGYSGDTYCTDCDEIISQGDYIPALGHKYNESIEKYPTSTENGIKRFTCMYCDKSYTEVIEKTQGSSESESDETTKDSEEVTKDSEKSNKDSRKEISDNPETGDLLKTGNIIIVFLAVIAIFACCFITKRNKISD